MQRKSQINLMQTEQQTNLDVYIMNFINSQWVSFKRAIYEL